MNNGEKAMSLISVVVAVGIAGILAVIVNQITTNNRRMMEKMKRDSQKERLKQIILNKYDCTLGPCELLAELIEKRIVGKWYFKTSCDSQKGLLIETRRQRDKTTPAKHPLNRKPEKWEKLFDLEQGYICNNKEDTDASLSEDSRAISTPTTRRSTPRKDTLRQKPSKAADSIKVNKKEIKQMIKGLNKEIEKFCPQGKSFKGFNPDNLDIICE
jgi:hypothetical protein